MHCTQAVTDEYALYCCVYSVCVCVCVCVCVWGGGGLGECICMFVFIVNEESRGEAALRPE